MRVGRKVALRVGRIERLGIKRVEIGRAERRLHNLALISAATPHERL